MKFIVLLFLLGIIASLGSGLFFLARDRKSGKQMANALTVRVALSIGLLLFLLVSWKLGLIGGGVQGG